MRLRDITARAAPAGNRIDLTWTNPDPVNFPGVRVVRRVGTHPVNETDGAIVADSVGLLAASDTGLQGETVYYYSLFPFKPGPPQAFEGDPHNRVSAMATAPYNFAGRMYALLPALYHRYDEAQSATGQLRPFLALSGSQLDQIYSFARAALDLCDLNRVEGSLLPLLGQWIGWQTNYALEIGAQRSELRFAPFLYQTIGLIPTVEATVKRVSNWESRTKEFVHNVARMNQPERLNLWSMLRPAAGAFGDASLASLNFAYEGRPTAVREADGSLTFFYQTYRRHGWDIWSKGFAGGQWRPSAPVVDQPGLDTHPVAAMQGAVLWLFWESFDEARQKWRINFLNRSAGVWSAPAPLFDAAAERRSPAAVADASGGVWLFWLERAATGGWTVRYNRHDGTKWLAAPVDFPLDGGADPRVEADLFLVFHPTSAAQRLWLFWARRDPGGPPGQSRWTICYRIKAGTDPAVSDWSVVRTLPKPAPDVHDREPSPIVGAGGNIELFWSSTRGGGWTLSNAVLNIAALTWSAAAALRNTPYSNRAPLAVDTGAGTLLAFRSNESLRYSSAVYAATQTLDARYGGATTADTRNAAKIALQGKLDDFQTYTYDAGESGVRGNDDRIARDTIGLYLTPDTADPAQIKEAVSKIANALPGFMPASERAVFITP